MNEDVDVHVMNPQKYDVSFRCQELRNFREVLVVTGMSYVEQPPNISPICLLSVSLFFLVVSNFLFVLYM